MIESYFQQLNDFLFRDKTYAWLFVSLLFWIAALALQILFTNSVKRAGKRISSKNLKSLQQKYLPKSITGWILFF